jgi:Mg2+ and Co2+ transporter CorA
VHGFGETPSSAWTFDTNAAKPDGAADLSKQEQTRLSKRNNPQKAKLDVPALENQIAITREHAVGLKQGLVMRDSDERTRARPEELPQSPSQGKDGVKNERVETWLQKTPPNVPIAPTAKQNLDGKVRWLRDPDLLPCDLERARILLFNYATPLDEGKPPPLAILTERLRSYLAKARENCNTRPIIFIGHDFGVTVIEKALMECAKNSSLVVDICSVTMGVLFFATPSESTSTEEKEIAYFDTKDTRLGPKGKIKYVEVQDANFLSDHLHNFKNFTDWLAGLRPAMALHSIQSDGKIASKDVDAYRQTLDKLNELLKVYPLLDAADEGNEDRVKTLLKEDPNPNLRDFADQSPLHLAVRKNHTQVVRLLLSNGADVCVQNSNGMTALHFAVTSKPKTGAIIEMLLDEGGDVDVLNSAGYSVLELAEQAGVKPASLKHQRLIKGPSEDISDRRREPVPPTLSSAVAACRELQATLAEFYLIERQEQLMIQRPYIYELLYERGPEEIMAAARKRGVPENLKPRCTWYHLPANHIGWVNDLFARLNIVPDSTQEDEHYGMTAWSRYMRPKARIFKPVQYVKDATDTWHSKQCTGKNFVLYIPFLNFERNCDMLAVYKLGQRRIEFVEERSAPVRMVRERSPRASTTDSDDDDSARHLRVRTPEEAIPTGRMPTWRQEEASTLYGGRRSTTSASSDDDPLDIEKKLLRGHLWSERLRKTGELHVRRTLDQSHYFMLEDTCDRDWDQVVLREARRSRRGKRLPISRRHRRHVAVSSTSSGTESENPQKNESEEFPLVIVDQLWLWVTGDTVVTSFPQKFRQPDWQLNCDVSEQLRQYLQFDKKRSPVTSAHDLANLIISYCVSVFNRSQPRLTGLTLHDYFETSVGVVADTEMKLFRAFEAASKEDPNKILEKQKKKGKKERKWDKKRQSYVETEDDKDDIFDIRKEIELLDEVKDIRDEIRMILRILNDQALAVGDVAAILQSDTPTLDPSSPHTFGRTDAGAEAVSSEAAETIDGRVSAPFIVVSSPDLSLPQAAQLDPSHQITTTFNEGTAKAPTRSDVVTTPYKQRHPVIDANIRDFERMLSHTNASYEALNHLLDLKQKQANALEARLARIGVEGGAKQSNIIMVFTVATIVFGSLSFVAAFFALNVTAFPKLADGATTAWSLGHIVGYVTGLAIALSLPFIAIAFMINPIAETVWSTKKTEKQGGPTGKWAKAMRKTFHFLIGSWLYRLPYFSKWKDSASMYSYAEYSGYSDYDSDMSIRKRSLPRRLLRSFASLFAALVGLLRQLAVKVRLVKARKTGSMYSSSSSSRSMRGRR